LDKSCGDFILSRFVDGLPGAAGTNGLRTEVLMGFGAVARDARARVSFRPRPARMPSLRGGGEVHGVGVEVASVSGVGEVVDAVEEPGRLAGDHDDRPGGPEPHDLVRGHEGTTITVPGIQIVAWVNAINPFCPLTGGPPSQPETRRLQVPAERHNPYALPYMESLHESALMYDILDEA
jgi:hypothetical protein